MVVRSDRPAHANRRPKSLPGVADDTQAHGRKVLIALMATLVAGLAIFWSMTQARAGGTVDDQMACTPDVFKLCSSEIPSEDRIVVCLNKKISQLSPACRKVMDGDEHPKRHSRR